MLGRRGADSEWTWTATLLGLGAFFSLQSMMAGMILWGDLLGPAPGDGAPQLRTLFRTWAMIAATPAVFLLGIPLALGLYRGGRLWPSDTLVLLGSLLAYGYSVWAAASGRDRIYFEVAAITLLLVTSGKLLEARARSAARRSLEGLRRLMPDETTRVEERGAVRVRVDSLRVGDRVRILPGERVPADGVIVEGEASIDASAITGESRPASVGPGSRASAGTLALDGVLELRVDAVAGNRLMDLMARAIETAGPTLRLADRAALLFAPFVLAVAVAAFLWGWHARGFSEGMLRLLAVAVVACPCAFGIAAPLALWTGIRRAASLGVVVRSGDALERLAGVRTILFDKTGTLTVPLEEGMAVSHAADMDEGSVFRIAASLASCSRHPGSRALVACGRRQGVEPALAQTVLERAGYGLEGRVLDRRCILGGRRWLEECGIAVDPALGDGGALLAVEGRHVGTFVSEERPRPGVSRAIEDLQRLGIAVRIVSGDGEDRVAAFARRLGVEAVGALDPIAKLRHVRGAGRVAVVGDGLNDAPALAAADVGIALAGGTDVARDAASVTVMGNDLGVLAPLVQVARQTRRRARACLAWAFGYNAVLLLAAGTGLLHPVLAALVMVASSLSVIAVAVRRERP